MPHRPPRTATVVGLVDFVKTRYGGTAHGDLPMS
jgi:hypothetical protein